MQKFNTETRAAEIKRLTQEYASQDMSFLNDFNERLREKFDEIGIEKEETAISITYKFLTSNDESAVKIRKYLGEDADLGIISHLLMNPPRSMSRRKKSSNPVSTGNSVSRIMMLSIDNNMTSGNYKLSVLYFKGKCCYCAKTLNNIPGDQYKATAEHLTPVSPNKKNSIRGGTRFGNMALCCSECNQSRGNQNLEKWMATTNRIRKGKKNSAIAQIKAFRKFVKYREFGKEFSTVIGEVVGRIEDEDAKRLKELGKNYRYGTRQEFLKNLSAEALRDLRAYPNKYGD